MPAAKSRGELGTLTIEGISAPSTARLDLRVASTGGDAVGYSSAQTSTRTIEAPHVDNTMAYELADFAQAIEAVRAGMRPFEAPAGTFGSIGHFRDVTLASLALMDEARRQTGISFPVDGGEDMEARIGFDASADADAIAPQGR